MRARALRALAVVAAVLATTVGCGAIQENTDVQGELVKAGYAEARGGVKLALPVELPEGYQLKKFWSVANVYDEAGVRTSIARSAEFDGPQGPVRVCEEVESVPGRLCPKSNAGITEKKDGLVRSVSVDGGEKADPRAVWGEVHYSAALEDWSWMAGA